MESSIFVKIFPTHPVRADIVAAYAGQLTATEAYQKLRTVQNEFELSVLLYLVSRNEYQARNRLLGQFSPNEILYPNFDGSTISNGEEHFDGAESLSTRTIDNLKALRDPLSRDEAVFMHAYTREYQPWACVVFQDHIYRGHVYCWLVDTRENGIEVMNIMGIRSSIYHLISQNLVRYNFPLYAMSAIRKFALTLSFDRIYLRVISPFPVMQKICASLGMRTPVEIVATDPQLEWMLGVYIDPVTNTYRNMDEDFFVGEGPVTSDEEAHDHSADYIIEAHQTLIGEAEFPIEIIHS